MHETDPLPESWTDGFVETDGVRLRYIRTGGDGPPLVVAHGVTDDAACRRPLIRDLADEYDVIAYDARGHGLSDAPDSGYDVDTRGADLLAVCDALDLDDPFFLGHSMGGDTVLAAAAAAPHRPRAVVAVDPACFLGPVEDEKAEDDQDDDTETSDADGGDGEGGGGHPDDMREMVQWWQDHSKAELIEADDELRAHAAAGEDEMASLLADARLRVSPEIQRVFDAGWLDPAERFPDIEAPTLIVRADADETERARDRDLASLIEDADLVHVDGAGHTVFRDERETATWAVRNFLEGNRGRLY